MLRYQGAQKISLTFLAFQYVQVVKARSYNAQTKLRRLLGNSDDEIYSTNEPRIHEINKIKETLLVSSLLSSPVDSLDAEVSIVIAEFPVDLSVCYLMRYAIFIPVISKAPRKCPSYINTIFPYCF